MASVRNENAGSRAQLAILVAIAATLVAAAGTAVADSADRPGGDHGFMRAEAAGVVWESRTEGARRVVTISEDGGRTWSEPRTAPDAIPLQAGMIVPGVAAPAVPKSLAGSEGNRVFLVQFETRSLSVWRDALRELGAEVLSYVPYDSHFIRIDPERIPLVESQPFVRWIGPYEPSYRIAPELLGTLDTSDVLVKRYNVVTYRPGADEKAQLADEVEAIGGQVVKANPDGYILEADLTDGQVLELLASNSVQWIDEWSAPEEDMNIGRAVAGADYVLATPAGYDGTGVRAEVMDGGIDTDHGDFPSPVPIHGGVSPAGTSHGTCTYGINFGTGAGNSAATGLVPNAYGFFAYYYGYSNRYTHTAELVDPSDVYKCVYQSNSWGNSRTLSYTSISQEMDDIIWQYDITIFQSQSNAGDQMSRPQAWAKNIVSVGGAYHFNDTDPTNDSWSFGASIGPAADGRIKPDLTFFYDAIYTTDADPGGYSGGAYTTSFGGTSGATPMVAGTAGLYFQMWQDNVWGTSPTEGTVFEDRPHFSTMKALLINNANQYDWTTTNPDLSRMRQGWGYPDAQNAYDRAAMTRVIDESSVLAAMEKDSYTAVVPASQDALKVTMVYADRAGVPGAGVHRINDVTLKVIAPDGTTTYWGNHGLDSGLWSSPGGSADTLNTVENVFIQNPAAGAWTIEVEAVEVNLDVHVETPDDDQDYALVVYGVTSLSTDGIFSDGFESGDPSLWDFVTP
jgi:hypothetical protein